MMLNNYITLMIFNADIFYISESDSIFYHFWIPNLFKGHMYLAYFTI